MKKLFLCLSMFVSALLFSVSASAQQNTSATEDIAFELPAMVSEKTVPQLDAAFANLPGVKVNFYCYNLDLVVLTVDRNLQHDNAVIKQKIHAIFETDDTMLNLEQKKSFNKNAYMQMCSEGNLIKR